MGKSAISGISFYQGYLCLNKCNNECETHLDFFNARMQTEKDCVTFLQVFDKIGTSAIYSLIFVLILHGIIITYVNCPVQ